MVSVWYGAVPGATRVWRSRTVRAAWRRLDHCHGGGARPIPGNRSHGSALTVRAARTTSVCPWSLGTNSGRQGRRRNRRRLICGALVICRRAPRAHLRAAQVSRFKDIGGGRGEAFVPTNGRRLNDIERIWHDLKALPGASYLR